MTSVHSPCRPFAIELDIDVGAGRAAVAGGLDMCSAPVLTESVSSLLRLREGDVLDLRGLQFLDPAGMTAFVEAANKLRVLGHPLSGHGASVVPGKRPASTRVVR
jgi:anti-anti-sigma regulatory factor